MYDGHPVWHTWPFGEQGHNVNDNLICPICWNKLRTVKRELTFDDGTELWTVICPHCRTRYVHQTQAGKLTEQSIDPRDDEIALLRRQVQYLYGIIKELQAQQKEPNLIPSLKEKNDHADHDDFTEKYRYLMS